MGASYFSSHSRESIVIGAKFFRDDLPYFVEALAEVASETKYLGKCDKYKAHTRARLTCLKTTNSGKRWLT